jgi:glucose dehydrogenase
MWLLSIVAIVLGLIVGIADTKLWMAADSWFLVAIALALLRPGQLPFVRRRT